MNDFDELGDNLSSEIDRRKLQHLIDTNQITEEELDHAEIVLLCSCGYEQHIRNEICEKCGKDIS